MKREMIFGQYFCGNKISDYGREHGFVDYATLAKAFDAVLNNQIISVTGWENWEQENGFVDNSEEIEELTQKLEALEDERTETLEMMGDCQLVSELDEKIYELEQERDSYEAEQDEQPEIFQYFIISGNGAQILEDYTNEIVFYTSDLDMYVWGVTHWGTGWDYVLTDIPCEREEVEKGA